MPATERPLTEAEYADLRSFHDAARLGMSGLAENAAPAEIVVAIGELVPAIREIDDEQQVAVCLCYGALWGEQVHRALGWDWVLFSPDGLEDETFALVSPERDYVISPIYLLLPYVRGAQEDDTSVLLFNMLMAGSLPASTPAAYLEIS